MMKQGLLLCLLFSMLLSSHAQSLDPLHPIAFEGNQIVYDGKLIRLDKHNLYLNSDLEESPSYPYAFKNFQKAVAHLGDSCTLYIAPGVYWVDNPDSPKVVRGENGREPFGCAIRAKNLHFIGSFKESAIRNGKPFSYTSNIILYKWQTHSGEKALG